MLLEHLQFGWSYRMEILCTTLFILLLHASVNGQPGFNNAGYSGVGICGVVAGCKTPVENPFCFGNAGGNVCDKCNAETISERNIMTIKAFNKRLLLHDCVRGECHDNAPKYFKEMGKYMLLTGDRVATSPQGAVFKNVDIPNFRYSDHYQTIFCGPKCMQVLKNACLNAQTMENVREWCLTTLEAVGKNLGQLKGPPSFILFLAAKLVRVKKAKLLQPLQQEKIVCSNGPCKWPESVAEAEYEENAALVAAAATTTLLAGDWFDHYSSDDSGFAVIHSLWLTTFAGRLRIRILPNDQPGVNAPGTKALCSKIGLKMQTSTGAVYAAICSLFTEKEIGLRYRLEIVSPPSLGCVEHTAGMVFIRPGDWIPSGAKFVKIGGSLFDSKLKGVQEYDDEGITTIELTNEACTLYPFNAINVMKDEKKTNCTEAVGFGWNGKGFLGESGLTGVAGICQWQPVW